MGLTAEASTVLFTSNWTSLETTTNVNDLGSGWYGSLSGISDGAAWVYGSNNGDYLCYAYTDLSNSEGHIYRYSFKYKSDSGSNTGNNASNIATWSGNDNQRTWQYFGVSTSPNDLGMTNTSTTYNVSIIVDNVLNKAVFFVDGVEKQTKNYYSHDSANAEISRGIDFRHGRGKTDYISNFTAYELTMPSITSESEITVGVGETLDLATVANANSVETFYSASGKATASYDSTTQKVSVTGVEEGDTVITLTAKGTDDYETTTKDITVHVGSAQNTTVTVKYLCGSEVVADEVAIDTLVGYTIDNIDYETSVIGDGCKYVFNSIDTSLPYTVEANGIITVNYDKKLPATSFVQNYKYGETVLKTETDSLTGLYADDTYDYHGYAYIEDSGHFYKSDSVGGTITLTAGVNTVNTAYTLDNDAVYFCEAEDATTSRHTTYGEYTGSDASGGTTWTATNHGNYTRFYPTIAESGMYTLTFGYCGNGRTDNIYVDTASNNWNYNGQSGEAPIDTVSGSSSGITTKSISNVYLSSGVHNIYAVVNYSLGTQLDYLLITKSDATAVSFEEQAAFVTTAGTTGTVRFNTKATPFNLDNATYRSHGFALVNLPTWTGSINTGDFSSTDTTRAKTTELTDSSTIDNFYYQITEITPAQANGVQFYAVPYIKYDSLADVQGAYSYFWGLPFTFTQDFDWTGDTVPNGTVQAGTVTNHTAVN